MLLAAWISLAALLSAFSEDPHRQFDFWVGQWDVQNRHLQADGSWQDGDRTRARITPVCGGRAVLEEWAGPFRGTFMNGFSLRAYDPAAKRWALLLLWTTDGNGSFGQLYGTFRHGRGEFFAGGGPSLTRYTFSDGLPLSVRWDSAQSADGGQTWKTDWIMEFSRTRAAHEVTQDNLFAEAWTEGQVTPHAAARRLDGMLGNWSGTQIDADGGEREARLRCKLLNKDCLVLDLLETRAQAPPGKSAGDWDERLCVRAFEARNRGWSSWSVSETDTRLKRFAGTFDGDVASFEQREPDGTTHTEYLMLGEADVLRIEESVLAPGADEARLVRTTVLERSPD